MVDGVAKASNIVKIRVGTETWEWTSYYDPVVALNPTFYQCAKIIAKLPGKFDAILPFLLEQSKLECSLARVPDGK